MASPAFAQLVETIRTERDSQPTEIGDLRAQMEAVAELIPLPKGLRIESIDAGGFRADRLTLSDREGDGVLIYLHGGAYVLGSPSTHRALAARIGEATGLPAFVPDYRLAPEHPFPAAVDDAVAAYRWLIANGTAPNRIVIAGDSAGGGLTAATLLALRDAGDPMPCAAVMISPWTDLAATGESLTTRQNADPMIYSHKISESAELYLGDADATTPLASPLYGDMAGLPPTLIHVGTAEVLFDDSTRMAARLEAAGVDVSLEVYDEMIHVWHYFAGMLPEADEAIEAIGRFVRARVPSGAVRK